MKTDTTEIKTSHLKKLFTLSLTPVQRAAYTAIQTAEAWRQVYTLTGRPLTYEHIDFLLTAASDDTPYGIEANALEADQTIASGITVLDALERTFEQIDEWELNNGEMEDENETVTILDDDDVLPFRIIDDL